MLPSQYIGRFAPSPTGPLHFGSLVSAVASYLDARANNGQWLVRMEDLDPPRELAEAPATILRQLEQHGLTWDGEVLFQGQRSEAYRDALNSLQQRHLAYPCSCTRQRVKSLNGAYDGHCRHSKGTARQNPLRGDCALRLLVPENTSVQFDDLFQGHQQRQLDTEIGDFILLRKDGLFAYQLAVALDDAFQGISHIIRGSDLLASTPRQIFVQQTLGLATPVYGHIPVAINIHGQKLSKQNRAPAVESGSASVNLGTAIAWLGFTLPPGLSGAPCIELLDWAVEHWRRERVPHIMAMPAPGE